MHHAREFMIQWESIEQFIRETIPEGLLMLGLDKIQEYRNKVGRTIEFVRDSMDGGVIAETPAYIQKSQDIIRQLDELYPIIDDAYYQRSLMAEKEDRHPAINKNTYMIGEAGTNIWALREYKDFLKDNKVLDPDDVGFWQVWILHAKEVGLSQYQTELIIHTFAPYGVGRKVIEESFVSERLGVDCPNCGSSNTERVEDFTPDTVRGGVGKITYADQNTKYEKYPERRDRDYITYNECFSCRHKWNPSNESFAMESVWRCSLCNIELEETDDVEQRKQRHEDFHKDESIQTGGRQRNWTFGEVDWTLEEPSTKTSLYEAVLGDGWIDYNETVAEELFFDLVDGTVKWGELNSEMKEDVIKFVDDNKLYMSFPATEGGWGSGRKDHQQWMNPAERMEDKVNSEDMIRDKFLTFQIEESTNPYLEEYNKAFDYWQRGGESW